MLLEKSQQLLGRVSLHKPLFPALKKDENARQFTVLFLMNLNRRDVTGECAAKPNQPGSETQ